MTPGARSVRAAGSTVVASQVLLAGNAVTWFAAARYDLNFAAEPSGFLTLGPEAIGLLRASMALDIAAYLAWLPLIALVHGANRSALSPVWSAGGFLYAVAGVVGAALFLGGMPPLIMAHVAGTDPFVLRAVFTSLTEAVYRGLWNVVGVTGLALWLIGVGAWLRKTRPWLGSLAMLGAVTGLADAVLTAAGTRQGAKVALGALGVLVPLWGLLVGVDLLRNAPAWAGAIASPAGSAASGTAWRAPDDPAP